MENEESYDFEIEIDLYTKIRCFDFSLRCRRPDLITVWILRKIRGKWQKIGKANIVVNSSKKARWADIIIGSDARFVLLNIPNPGYSFRKFRRKGIGSRVVQHLLNYLKQNGIEEVYGEISDRDIFERASNFWRKNGFTVTQYARPKGHFVAQINRKL